MGLLLDYLRREEGRLLHVLFKLVGHLLVKGPVVDEDIIFKVQVIRPVVLVDAADSRVLVVDDNGLGVHEAVVVGVDLDPDLDQLVGVPLGCPGR